MPSKNNTLTTITVNKIVWSISLSVRISLLVIQINGLEYWHDIITENRLIFSAKLENKGSHYNPLPLPAKFCFVEILPGEILWMRIFTMVKFRGCVFRPNEISAKQNFTWVDAKFHQDDCEISLDSMKIHRCLQNFVEFSQEQIHQISLSFLLHSTVSTVFHKPYSSINVSVKMNLSTCLEQGVADIEMHLHEWLQQWRQLNWWASLPQEKDQLPGWFLNLFLYNTVRDYLLKLRNVLYVRFLNELINGILVLIW